MSVHLLSSDNEQFTVDKEVAERSVLIKNMLEGKPKYRLVYTCILFLYRWKWILKRIITIDIGESDAPIPLPNVTAKVLGKVKYCPPCLAVTCIEWRVLIFYLLFYLFFPFFTCVFIILLLGHWMVQSPPWRSLDTRWSGKTQHWHWRVGPEIYGGWPRNFVWHYFGI
jgi:hypothetical protein